MSGFVGQGRWCEWARIPVPPPRRRRPRSAGTSVALAAALSLSVSTPSPRCEPVEPPAEAPEGVDYEAEAPDSLGSGFVEIGMGAVGSSGQAPRRRRRVRFSSDSLGGAVRDGAGDPLAGSSIEGQTKRGAFGLGRFTPRWGRGIATGTPLPPWSRTALEPRERPAYRARSGDGMWYGGNRGALRYGGHYGRFARRDVGAMNAGLGAVGVALFGDRAGVRQASVWLDGTSTRSELVAERSGRWRAEVAAERGVGQGQVAGMVRAGSAAFRSMVEPQGGVPAHALAAAVHGPAGPLEVDAIGAVWRFRPGLAGARAAFQVEGTLKANARFAAGFEEQQGVRRSSSTTASGSTSERLGGFRHGLWGEWSGASGGVRLALRHEAWGEGRFARRSVRIVTTARVETTAPAEVRLRVTHTVFRVRRGESLFVPEAEADRLVLRVLSGAGDRTRVEIAVPTAGGRLAATLALSTSASGPQPPRWTIEWARRARLARDT